MTVSKLFLKISFQQNLRGSPLRYVYHNKTFLETYRQDILIVCLFLRFNVNAIFEHAGPWVEPQTFLSRSI